LEQNNKTNFIFHDDLISIIIKLLDCKGIINIGGKSQSVYNFAKKYNSKIKKISAKNILGKNARLNLSMDLNKLKKTIND
jgi:dTDP-4-dehydrorhamnose reductase